MSYKHTIEAADDMGLRLTQPIENYQKIKCLVGNGKKLPDLCYQACGLACAKECLRWSDRVCPGCPCLIK